MKKQTICLGAGAAGPPPGAVQAALDALDCQIAVLTETGDVVLANAAWRKMAESDVPCATHVPAGANYLEAFNERDAMSPEARQAAAGVGAVLARRMNRFSVEYPCQSCGEKLWFQMNATACEISGSPHAVVVHRSVRQADERRQTEEELRALLARKEEFLATLLHELRNPLAPIVNALELLSREAHDPQCVGRARGIIQRQIRQITRLVDDLFDASRMKREHIEMNRARIDVCDVVNVAIETAQPLIDLRRHVLTKSVAPGRYFVHADPTRLAQVLTNVLINAAKYTKPGGHISVITEQTDTDVRVRVRDSGVGIAPEHLSRVFELFAQTSSEADARMGGLGIGLAVARELMRLQGGSIAVQSEGLGRGSEFTIWLPAAPDAIEHEP